ncbi:MAG: glutathione S-transferase [Gammaproteobacteria bacterium CG11_big_fil_rev_8_21_14_0_20_46_22]|nr:MAG: glutathione S-transferase [Gammaproteobacteria bacterium CG12_big_fil_rev_8_21_14_0_65_46_12]PIR11181.1 MAG: glutathione S-transferase [Gammaproteobacteria bacterium CG11_big_fil_rev_8_21_14_0_20_46_22]
MESLNKPKLISFELCPFVQRSVIVLKEKNVDFDLEYIDLFNKPQWFQKISPLGKAPVLLINGQAIFESAVIAELLDEVYLPKLHPVDPYLKAKNRAWIEFGSSAIITLFMACTANSKEGFDQMREKTLGMLATLDREVKGPYFNGEDFSLLDTAYAPFFMRISKLEEMYPLNLLNQFQCLQSWSKSLLARKSVISSEIPDYVEKFKTLLEKKGSYLMTISEK